MMFGLQNSAQNVVGLSDRLHLIVNSKRLRLKLMDGEPAILGEIRIARQQCRILNAELLSLAGKKARESAKLERLRSDNDSLSHRIDEMKDIAESCERFDFEALKREIETLETALVEHGRTEDQLMLDIDRLNTAATVQQESQQKQELYWEVNGKVHGCPRNQKDGEESYFIAIRRGLERDLEVLERKDARPRTIARKRSQVRHAQALGA
jgi:seryl-tRNA synthetase